MKKFLIGTGYVRNAATPIPPNEFFEVWVDNVWKVNPEKIFVVCAGGACPSVAAGVQIHYCKGDLGHIRDKHEGRNNYPFTGWAGGMMLAAMTAYNECLDFIYKEQDCLAFGDWVEQLYADMGNGEAVLGRGLKPPHHKLMSSQSLFLVKHRQIPRFIRDYVDCGYDMAMGPGTGENKFKRMIETYPEQYRVQTGWSVDRDRPLPVDKKTWAAQQITPAEFDTLKKLQLI